MTKPEITWQNVHFWLPKQTAFKWMGYLFHISPLSPHISLFSCIAGISHRDVSINMLGMEMKSASTGANNSESIYCFYTPAEYFITCRMFHDSLYTDPCQFNLRRLQWLLRYGSAKISIFHRLSAMTACHKPTLPIAATPGYQTWYSCHRTKRSEQMHCDFPQLDVSRDPSKGPWEWC